MSQKPPQYWRANKEWASWIGKQGTVIATTRVQVASPEFEQAVPYSYVIVELDGVKKELMGAGHEELQPGDEVKVVLRKTAQSSAADLIAYGLKVTKV